LNFEQICGLPFDDSNRKCLISKCEAQLELKNKNIAIFVSRNDVITSFLSLIKGRKVLYRCKGTRNKDFFLFLQFFFEESINMRINHNNQ
jgi:hypothetical protein